MTKFTQTLFAVAAMALACGAQAATIQQTLPQTTTIFDVEIHPGSLSFAQFDSHLGSLTSVSFELFSVLNGTIKLTNKDAVSEYFGVGTGADLTASLAGQSVVTGNWVSTGYLLAAGASVTDSLAPKTESKVLSFTSPADLALFIGNSTYSATVSALSDQTLSGGGNAKYGTNVTVDAYARLTYTYTTAPVPEPETYAMLLAGLGLVGAVARRRKTV